VLPHEEDDVPRTPIGAQRIYAKPAASSSPPVSLGAEVTKTVQTPWVKGLLISAGVIGVGFGAYVLINDAPRRVMKALDE
jgi:hypothetical protein